MADDTQYEDIYSFPILKLRSVPLLDGRKVVAFGISGQSEFDDEPWLTEAQIVELIGDLADRINYYVDLSPKDR